MIDDPELRMLFQTESEERIAHLKEGIRELQENPEPGIIEAIFRDAHTLKGAARMLSLADIGGVAGALEEALDKIRKGTVELQPKIFEEIFTMVAELERLTINQLQTEKKEAPKLLKREKSEFSSVAPKADAPFLSKPSASDDEIHKIVSVVVGAQTDPTHSASLSFQSTTVRVPKKQIFELARHSADLMVTKNKLTTFVDDIEVILKVVEKSREELSNEWLGKDTSKWEEVLREIETRLSKLRESSYEDVFKLSDITSVLVSEIRSLGLLPFSKLFDLFPHMVEEIAHACGKEVIFNIEGEDINVDKKIIEEMKDPIMHLLRNSISHGIETPEQRIQLSKPPRGNITLRAQQISQTIIIEISDDGHGLDPQKIRKKALDQKLFTEEALAAMTLPEIYAIIFIPGFSTADQVSEISGRGVGLDVVKDHVERLQGTIQVESQPGLGCKFIVELPTSVLTTRVSIIQIYQEIYAIPIEAIESVSLISYEEIFQIHNRDVLLYKNQPIPIYFLASLLNVTPPTNQNVSLTNLQGSKIPCIIFNIRDKLLAVIVDAILDEQQVVLMPFKTLLAKIPNLAGATTLKTGHVCLVVDPLQIIKCIQSNVEKRGDFIKLKKAVQEIKMKKKVLLVDDSYAIRLYCKKILEDSGYEVVIAEDGIDALQKFDAGGIDAIISDIQMPQMDGLTLIKLIREKRKNFTIPIVLMSTLESDSDRQRGIEAGANAYIRKSAFSQKELTSLLKNLIL